MGPLHLFTHLSSDENHEFYGGTCIYLTESELQDKDVTNCVGDLEYDEVYTRYLKACDATIQVRSEHGFFPVVTPEATLRHLEKSFPSKDKGGCKSFGKNPAKDKSQGRANQAKLLFASHLHLHPDTGNSDQSQPSLHSHGYVCSSLRARAFTIVDS